MALLRGRWLAVLVAAGLALGGAACGGGSKSVALSGTVTGAPGVTVTLSGAATATVTTDATGCYEFTGLERGEYTLTPSLAGFAFAPAARTVSIGSADVASQDFTATPGLAWDQGTWDQAAWH